MERMLLRIHQGNVADACKAALIAVDDIESFGARESGRLWYGVQNLVVAAGNVSKTLFGGGREPARSQRYEARRPLRESLQVTDDSPLRKVVIRNDFEHLDERVDMWWKETPNRNFIDAMVGPRAGFLRVSDDSFGDKDMLRWLDPETGLLVFWGNELHIPSVMQEMTRIFPLAEAERQKPHWDAE